MTYAQLLMLTKNYGLKNSAFQVQIVHLKKQAEEQSYNLPLQISFSSNFIVRGVEI